MILYIEQQENLNNQNTFSKNSLQIEGKEVVN